MAGDAAAQKAATKNVTGNALQRSAGAILAATNARRHRDVGIVPKVNQPLCWTRIGFID
jgi:hypothetical protein